MVTDMELIFGQSITHDKIKTVLKSVQSALTHLQHRPKICLSQCNYESFFSYSQSVSSLKLFQKSIFVLSWVAPIRSGERPVWASNLIIEMHPRVVLRRENMPLGLEVVSRW